MAGLPDAGIELCIECDEANGWLKLGFYPDGSSSCYCSDANGNCYAEPAD
jgi:hypothetical protein